MQCSHFHMDINQTDILKIVQASENIGCEYITNAFHIKVLVITSITFKNDYSDVIDFKLPNTLKKLIFGSRINGPITLPNSLELFHMRYYNGPIILPKNLKILYIYMGNNHKIYLPDKLTCVVFFGHHGFSSQLREYMDNLPDCVKTIHVASTFPWENIPRSVENVVIHIKSFNSDRHNERIFSFRRKIMETHPNILVRVKDDCTISSLQLLEEHLK